MSDFPVARLRRLIAGSLDAGARDDQALISPGEPPQPPSSEQPSGPPETVVPDGPPLMALRGLRAGELIDAHFEGRAGEIVGAVGLLGSGVIDLARTLTGRLRAEEGEVILDGAVADLGDFAGLTQRGLGAVVGSREDRVAMPLSVQENLTLGILRRFFRRGVLNRRAERASAMAAIAQYEVRCAGPDVEMARLSGGNQQKAAIAKVLEAHPRVLVLEEPCHGVDERGRGEIATMLARVAADGALVLVIDSDLTEVASLCSRVVVFRSGRVAGEFNKGEISRSRLLEACYGSIE